MNDIYEKYKEARNNFYIEKKWVAKNLDLLKTEYTDEGLDIPCEGFVRNKEDAEKAVIFYTAFYNKLEYENKLNDKIKETFARTIKKYTDYE